MKSLAQKQTKTTAVDKQKQSRISSEEPRRSSRFKKNQDEDEDGEAPVDKRNKSKDTALGRSSSRNKSAAKVTMI